MLFKTDGNWSKFSLSTIFCRTLSIILVLMTQRDPSDCCSASLKSIGPVMSSSGMKLLNSPFAVGMSPPPPPYLEPFPRSLPLAAFEIAGKSWIKSDRSSICKEAQVDLLKAGPWVTFSQTVPRVAILSCAYHVPSALSALLRKRAVAKEIFSSPSVGLPCVRCVSFSRRRRRVSQG